MTDELIAQPVAPKRRIAWFSVTVAMVSAVASVGSMFVAWRTLNAYPEQLATSERLRACVALQEQSSRFVGAVANYQYSLRDGDDAEFDRDADAVSRLDSETSSILATLQMLGPASVLDAARDLDAKMELLIRAAEDGQQDAELHDEAREVGDAQRRFGVACADAVRGIAT